MNLLIRQARDILVCAYHGNLENFVRTYLSPAAALLAEVKSVASETVSYFTTHDFSLALVSENLKRGLRLMDFARRVARVKIRPL